MDKTQKMFPLSTKYHQIVNKINEINDRIGIESWTTEIQTKEIKDYFFLLKNKANEGDSETQNCIGFCYYHGFGTEKNLSKSLEYW